jgi:uncharacterized protein YfaA (DUF2138 family)
MNKRTLGKILLGVAVGATALVGYRSFGRGMLGPVNSLELDLAHPDALVLTSSLSSLPRDLLTVPLARDVLREDFLFYYEQSEDRLGLKGSLRRIAYEHELTWGDQLIRSVLDEPAEVALWRGADGSLKHYAIAVTRSSLTRLMEEAGKVALKDSQLRRAGDIAVGGDRVPVYALEYAYQRTLLFAARGNRMVILSHPGMLLGGGDGTAPDDKAVEVVTSLLLPDRAHQQVFHAQFHLGDMPSTGHSVAVKADFLSFGYQPFFGALQAVRFDFAHGRWQTQALIDGERLRQGGYDNRALWSVLPYDPSACFAVPADWKAMAPVFERLGKNVSAALTPLAAQFSGPAAACWYGSSRLHTPVFVARRAPGVTDTALLGAAFGAAIAPDTAPETADGTARWAHDIDTPAGQATATLAVHGDLVVFSADPALVDKVLAVQRKRAAAAADRLPDPSHTVGLIAPAQLSQLIEKEAFDALPAASEPVLRGAAEAHLIPRLAALRKYGPYRMVVKAMPASGTAWEPLEWQAAGR